MKLETVHGSVKRLSVYVVFPGGDENEPRLLRKTSSGCHYELAWFTAFACALSHKSGENCRVEDSDAGTKKSNFEFDDQHYNILHVKFYY